MEGWVREMEHLFDLEAKVLLWIQENIRNDVLSLFLIFITKLGDLGVIWIALTAVLVICKKTRKKGCVAGVSLTLTALVTNLVLKRLVQRTRPYDAIDNLEILVPRLEDFSFPSGHTAVSFGVAVAIYMLFPKKYGYAALALAFLIGLSRLYVGVHYPTDVIGGALTGIVTAVLTVKAGQKWFGIERKQRIVR